jgi:hypothetical protein
MVQQKIVTIDGAPSEYVMVVDGKAVVFVKGRAVVDVDVADKIETLAKENGNPRFHFKRYTKPRAKPKPKTEETKKDEK